MNPFVGGVCLHDGTIPSKSFREAIMHLSGYRERAHYGRAYRVKHNVTMKDLTKRSSGIITDCEQTVRAQLHRNKVDIIEGYGSLVDANTIKVTNGDHEVLLTTDFCVLATGTRPWHPPGFDFDGEVVLDSDSILHMENLPKSLSVVGGGVIGCEYGSMFAALGIKVTIVEARPQILGFVDSELVDSLVYKLREQKAVVVTNDKVIRCTRTDDGRAVTYLESGKRIVTHRLLVSAGRQGNVEKLNLDSVGIEHDARGRISVNANYQTSLKNVYAVGDVIGFPALASTSMEQGRFATCHAFNVSEKNHNLPMPAGIYTVPEIATVGKTEEELSALKTNL
ncbi:UNVERIFIED_CONTAM: hypothetical protein GTU68_049586 [Idotea baltica]|nr:hypothetical protein [Idotea baltica]